MSKLNIFLVPTHECNEYNKKFVTTVEYSAHKDLHGLELEEHVVDPEDTDHSEYLKDVVILYVSALIDRLCYEDRVVWNEGEDVDVRERGAE